MEAKEVKYDLKKLNPCGDALEYYENYTTFKDAW